MTEVWKQAFAGVATKLIEQAPSIVVLVIILMHQQWQINMLIEKCVVGQ